MHTVSRRAALAGLAFFALWPGPAGAQEQTLKIVFPFAAGGSAEMRSPGCLRITCRRASAGP